MNNKVIKFWAKWKWAILGGGVIVFLAVFLRFYHLTILPVFADEAIYIRWAQVMQAEATLRFLPLSDGKQPLFMWLVIPFLKFVSDPLLAGRLVSCISGLFSLIGIFFLSFLLFRSKKAALVSSLLYALCPFAVFFDRMALVDSLLAMFGVWTLIGVIVTVRTLRLDAAMITGFLLGGALLTKSPALFFSILLPLAVVLVKGKKRVLKFVLLLIPTYLIAYAIYNLLRLGPNFHLLAQRNLDYVYPLTHLLISPLDPFNPFLDRIRQYFVILGPWPILILPLLGIAFNFKKFTKELFLIAAWFLFPILVSAEFSKTMTARYVLSSLPFLMVLAGAAMEGAKNLKLRVGVWLLILVSLIQSLFLVGKLLTKPESANLPRSERSGYLEEWTAGTGIKEAAAFFKTQTENLPPGKQVVVGTEGYFGTLPDGLQIYLNNYPRLTVIGVGLNFDKVPSPLVDSAKSGNKTYLLVNASRFDGNAEALGLNLRETFPKAVKPDGTHDTLNLFEVTPNEIKQVKP